MLASRCPAALTFVQPPSPAIATSGCTSASMLNWVFMSPPTMLVLMGLSAHPGFFQGVHDQHKVTSAHTQRPAFPLHLHSQGCLRHLRITRDKGSPQGCLSSRGWLCRVAWLVYSAGHEFCARIFAQYRYLLQSRTIEKLQPHVAPWKLCTTWHAHSDSDVPRPSTRRGRG